MKDNLADLDRQIATLLGREKLSAVEVKVLCEKVRGV